MQNQSHKSIVVARVFYIVVVYLYLHIRNHYSTTMNKLVSRSFLSIHQNRLTSNRLLRLTTPRVSSVVLNQPTTSSAGSNLGVFLNSSRQVRFRTRFLNYLDRVHLRMHSELDCVVCSSVAWPIFIAYLFDPAIRPRPPCVHHR